MTRKVPVVGVLLLLIAISLSCKTEPSPLCTAGPYSFDNNVQRCRAYDGEFALTACCNR